MTRQQRRIDDDDSPFDARGVLRDGATARVPMMLRDAALTPLQRAVAQNVHATLHDGRGNRDVVGHRPGHIVSDAVNTDAIEEAYRLRDAEDRNAWRGGAGVEGREGTQCTVMNGEFPEHFGALQCLSGRVRSSRGDARHTRYRGYAAIPRGLGFRGSEKPPLPFIEMRQDRRVALLERIFIDHPQNYDAPRRHGIPLPCCQARPDSAIV
jgi:hypothetical protein